jgi:cell division protein FtsB
MKKTAPLQLWSCAFALWGLFLSGVFANLVGSPGVIQAVRLKNLLEAKQTQITQVQEELQRLELQIVQLEQSKVTQQLEIRRVLGYAAADEIIFDFTRPAL